MLKARLVTKVLKAHKAFKVLLAQLDYKESRVLKALLVFKVNKVSKALKEM